MTKWQGRLWISIIANCVSMCVSFGISFVLTPFLISSIGKEAYSFFPIANNIAAYMTILTAALNSMATRFITVAYAGGKEEEAAKYFSSVFYSNVLLSCMLFVPMTGIILNIAHFLDIPKGLEAEVIILFVLVFAALIVGLISSVFQVATFARERMDLAAVQSVIMSLLRAGLFFGLFYFLKPSVIYIGIVTLIIAVCNLVAGIGFTRLLMPQYIIRWDKFHWKAVKVLIDSGIWNAVSSLGSALLFWVSILLSNTFISASAGGDMSIVQTLPNVISTVISTIFGVLLPRITVEYADGDREKTKECVLQSQKILGIVSSAPVVIIILFGKHFFRLWVPGEDAGYLQILSVITVGPFLLHSAMWTVTGLNTVNNKVKEPALLFLLTGMCSIALTFMMLQYTNFGVFAIAGVSSICNILFYLIFIPRYAAKHMGFEKWIFYPHILKTFVFAATMILLLMPIVNKLEITNWGIFFLACGFIEVIGVMLYAFLVLNRSDRQLIKSFIQRMRHG